MSTIFQLVLLALFSCIGLTQGAQKYFSVDGIKKCESKSSELNNCVKGNAKIAWPILLKGIKDFCIPPLDPYELRTLDLAHDGSAISGKVSATDIKVIGLANLQIKSLDVKVPNKKKITLKTKFSVSKLKITGSYSGQVKVTLLSVKPKGTFNLMLDDVEVDAIAEADVSSRDGHSFAKVTELKLEPKIAELHLEANEMSVSSFLSKPVINKINKDWSSYYNTLMPQSRKVWLPQIEKLLNKVLNVTPIENVIDL